MPASHPFRGWIEDVRRAGRQLRSNPWFAAVAVLTIGLGIGANTAIFSVVDAVLLEPLPYRQPDRLVVVLQNGNGPVSPANLTEWREAARSFDGLGAAELWSTTLTGVAEAERLSAVRVTPDLFPLLGVRPALGRLFGPGDDTGDAAPVLLSDRLWRRRFGADPAIVGATIQLNGGAHPVAGVMPPSFRFPPFWAADAELWAPLPFATRATSRAESIRVFGRLRDGTTLAQARSEMAALTARLDEALPGSNRGIQVLALGDRVVGNVRPVLFLLTGAVGFVLLIACANVAHLLMARATTRRREIAVRSALGASRGELVRQLLVESGVLALLGGALGLGLAAAGVSLLGKLGPGTIPRLDLVRLDGTVLLFTLVLSLGTGVLFGIAPAWSGSRADLSTVLRSGARGGTGEASQRRWRDLMVGSQFALAVVLLIGAGLTIRSFVARLSIDAGFDPRDVTTMVVSVAGAPSGAPERRTGFYREVLDGVGRLPGVEAASMINHLPLAGDVWSRSYQIEGTPPPEPGREPRAAYRVVWPDYFRTVRLPLVAGRDFGVEDDENRPPVIIVNEALARRVWPGQDPIGRRIALQSPDPDIVWLTVVGVVGNAVRSEWTAEPAAEVYLPYLQSPSYRSGVSAPWAYQTLVVRSSAPPAATIAAVRRLVAGLDRDVPVSSAQTLEQVIGKANAEPRFNLFLLATFATLALLLAAVGIYGVMSYTVAQRTREIGIRMTLGAGRGAILGQVVGRGTLVALAGAVVGVIASLGLTRYLANQLYGVRPNDPVTFAMVPALLVLVALAATIVPAVRAARLDPALAVRAGEDGAG